MSGGRGARTVYYLVRRHLGLTPVEWDALAWWEQKMYLDGMESEGLIEFATGGPVDSTVTAEEVHRSEGTTIIERTHTANFSGIPGEMTAFGLPERTI